MNIKILESILNSLSPLKTNDYLCTKIITPRSNCNLCQEVCPVNGIKISKETIEINNCIYCGKCVNVCPNHVFRLEEDKLLKESKASKTLLITCQPLIEDKKISPNEKLMQINCLNQLYPELVIYLLTKLDNLLIFSDPKYCIKCLNFNTGHFISKIAKIITIPDKLHLITDKDKLKNYLKPEKESKSQVNRRQFFTSFFHETKIFSKKIIATALDEPLEKTKQKPLKKYFLQKALKEMDKKNIKDILPFKNLQVDFCIFCGVCAQLCPTQAIQIAEENNMKKLQFKIQDCTQCGICQEVCLHHTLTFGKEISKDSYLDKEPQILIKGEEQICQICHHKYWEAPVTEKEICFFCRKQLDIKEPLV